MCLEGIFKFSSVALTTETSKQTLPTSDPKLKNMNDETASLIYKSKTNACVLKSQISLSNYRPVTTAKYFCLYYPTFMMLNTTLKRFEDNALILTHSELIVNTPNGQTPSLLTYHFSTSRQKIHPNAYFRLTTTVISTPTPSFSNDMKGSSKTSITRSFLSAKKRSAMSTNITPSNYRKKLDSTPALQPYSQPVKSTAITSITNLSSNFMKRNVITSITNPSSYKRKSNAITSIKNPSSYVMKSNAVTSPTNPSSVVMKSNAITSVTNPWSFITKSIAITSSTNPSSHILKSNIVTSPTNPSSHTMKSNTVTSSTNPFSFVMKANAVLSITNPSTYVMKSNAVTSPTYPYSYKLKRNTVTSPTNLSRYKMKANAVPSITNPSRYKMKSNAVTSPTNPSSYKLKRNTVTSPTNPSRYKMKRNTVTSPTNPSRYKMKRNTVTSPTNPSRYKMKSNAVTLPTNPSSYKIKSYTVISPTNPSSYVMKSNPVTSPTNPSSYKLKSNTVSSPTNPSSVVMKSNAITSVTNPWSYIMKSIAITSSTNPSSHILKSNTVTSPTNPSSYKLKSNTGMSPTNPSSYIIKSHAVTSTTKLSYHSMKRTAMKPSVKPTFPRAKKDLVKSSTQELSALAKSAAMTSIIKPPYRSVKTGTLSLIVKSLSHTMKRRSTMDLATKSSGDFTKKNIVTSITTLFSNPLKTRATCAKKLTSRPLSQCTSSDSASLIVERISHRTDNRRIPLEQSFVALWKNSTNLSVKSSLVVTSTITMLFSENNTSMWAELFIAPFSENILAPSAMSSTVFSSSDVTMSHAAQLFFPSKKNISPHTYYYQRISYLMHSETSAFTSKHFTLLNFPITTVNFANLPQEILRKSTSSIILTFLRSYSKYNSTNRFSINSQNKKTISSKVILTALRSGEHVITNKLDNLRSITIRMSLKILDDCMFLLSTLKFSQVFTFSVTNSSTELSGRSVTLPTTKLQVSCDKSANIAIAQHVTKSHAILVDMFYSKILTTDLINAVFKNLTTEPRKNETKLSFGALTSFVIEETTTGPDENLLDILQNDSSSGNLVSNAIEESIHGSGKIMQDVVSTYMSVSNSPIITSMEIGYKPNKSLVDVVSTKVASGDFASNSIEEFSGKLNKISFNNFSQIFLARLTRNEIKTVKNALATETSSKNILKNGQEELNKMQIETMVDMPVTDLTNNKLKTTRGTLVVKHFTTLTTNSFTATVCKRIPKIVEKPIGKLQTMIFSFHKFPNDIFKKFTNGAEKVSTHGLIRESPFIDVTTSVIEKSAIESNQTFENMHYQEVFCGDFTTNTLKKLVAQNQDISENTHRIYIATNGFATYVDEMLTKTPFKNFSHVLTTKLAPGDLTSNCIKTITNNLNETLANTLSSEILSGDFTIIAFVEPKELAKQTTGNDDFNTKLTSSCVHEASTKITVERTTDMFTNKFFFMDFSSNVREEMTTTPQKTLGNLFFTEYSIVRFNINTSNKAIVSTDTSSGNSINSIQNKITNKLAETTTGRNVAKISTVTLPTNMLIEFIKQPDKILTNFLTTEIYSGNFFTIVTQKMIHIAVTKASLIQRNRTEILTSRFTIKIIEKFAKTYEVTPKHTQSTEILRSNILNIAHIKSATAPAVHSLHTTHTKTSTLTLPSNITKELTKRQNKTLSNIFTAEFFSGDFATTLSQGMTNKSNVTKVDEHVAQILTCKFTTGNNIIENLATSQKATPKHTHSAEISSGNLLNMEHMKFTSAPQKTSSNASFTNISTVNLTANITQKFTKRPNESNKSLFNVFTAKFFAGDFVIIASQEITNTSKADSFDNHVTEILTSRFTTNIIENLAQTYAGAATHRPLQSTEILLSILSNIIHMKFTTTSAKTLSSRSFTKISTDTLPINIQEESIAKTSTAVLPTNITPEFAKRPNKSLFNVFTTEVFSGDFFTIITQKMAEILSSRFTNNINENLAKTVEVTPKHTQGTKILSGYLSNITVMKSTTTSRKTAKNANFTKISTATSPTNILKEFTRQTNAILSNFLTSEVFSGDFVTIITQKLTIFYITKASSIRRNFTETLTSGSTINIIEKLAKTLELTPKHTQSTEVLSGNLSNTAHIKATTTPAVNSLNTTHAQRSTVTSSINITREFTKRPNKTLTNVFTAEIFSGDFVTTFTREVANASNITGVDEHVTEILSSRFTYNIIEKLAITLEVTSKLTQSSEVLSGDTLHTAIIKFTTTPAANSLYTTQVDIPTVTFTTDITLQFAKRPNEPFVNAFTTEVLSGDFVSTFSQEMTNTSNVDSVVDQFSEILNSRFTANIIEKLIKTIEPTLKHTQSTKISSSNLLNITHIKFTITRGNTSSNKSLTKTSIVTLPTNMLKESTKQPNKISSNFFTTEVFSGSFSTIITQKMTNAGVTKASLFFGKFNKILTSRFTTSIIDNLAQTHEVTPKHQSTKTSLGNLLNLAHVKTTTAFAVNSSNTIQAKISTSALPTNITPEFTTPPNKPFVNIFTTEDFSGDFFTIVIQKMTNASNVTGVDEHVTEILTRRFTNNINEKFAITLEVTSTYTHFTQSTKISSDNLLHSAIIKLTSTPIVTSLDTTQVKISTAALSTNITQKFTKRLNKTFTNVFTAKFFTGNFVNTFSQEMTNTSNVDLVDMHVTEISISEFTAYISENFSKTLEVTPNYTQSTEISLDDLLNITLIQFLTTLAKISSNTSFTKILIVPPTANITQKFSKQPNKPFVNTFDAEVFSGDCFTIVTQKKTNTSNLIGVDEHFTEIWTSTFPAYIIENLGKTLEVTPKYTQNSEISSGELSNIARIKSTITPRKTLSNASFTKISITTLSTNILEKFTTRINKSLSNAFTAEVVPGDFNVIITQKMINIGATKASSVQGNFTKILINRFTTSIIKNLAEVLEVTPKHTQSTEILSVDLLNITHTKTITSTSAEHSLDTVKAKISTLSFPTNITPEFTKRSNETFTNVFLAEFFFGNFVTTFSQKIKNTSNLTGIYEHFTKILISEKLTTFGVTSKHTQSTEVLSDLKFTTTPAEISSNTNFTKITTITLTANITHKLAIQQNKTSTNFFATEIFSGNFVIITQKMVNTSNATGVDKHVIKILTSRFTTNIMEDLGKTLEVTPKYTYSAEISLGDSLNITVIEIQFTTTLAKTSSNTSFNQISTISLTANITQDFTKRPNKPFVNIFTAEDLDFFTIVTRKKTITSKLLGVDEQLTEILTSRFPTNISEKLAKILEVTPKRTQSIKISSVDLLNITFMQFLTTPAVILSKLNFTKIPIVPLTTNVTQKFTKRQNKTLVNVFTTDVFSGDCFSIITKKISNTGMTEVSEVDKYFTEVSTGGFTSNISSSDITLIASEKTPGAPPQKILKGEDFTEFLPAIFTITANKKVTTKSDKSSIDVFTDDNMFSVTIFITNTLKNISNKTHETFSSRDRNVILTSSFIMKVPQTVMKVPQINKIFTSITTVNSSKDFMMSKVDKVTIKTKMFTHNYLFGDNFTTTFKQSKNTAHLKFFKDVFTVNRVVHAQNTKKTHKILGNFFTTEISFDEFTINVNKRLAINLNKTYVHEDQTKLLRDGFTFNTKTKVTVAPSKALSNALATQRLIGSFATNYFAKVKTTQNNTSASTYLTEILTVGSAMTISKIFTNISYHIAEDINATKNLSIGFITFTNSELTIISNTNIVNVFSTAGLSAQLFTGTIDKFNSSASNESFTDVHFFKTSPGEVVNKNAAKTPAEIFVNLFSTNVTISRISVTLSVTYSVSDILPKHVAFSPRINFLITTKQEKKDVISTTTTFTGIIKALKTRPKHKHLTTITDNVTAMRKFYTKVSSVLFNAAMATSSLVTVFFPKSFTRASWPSKKIMKMLTTGFVSKVKSFSETGSDLKNVTAMAELSKTTATFKSNDVADFMTFNESVLVTVISCQQIFVSIKQKIGDLNTIVKENSLKTVSESLSIVDLKTYAKTLQQLNSFRKISFFKSQISTIQSLAESEVEVFENFLSKSKTITKTQKPGLASSVKALIFLKSRGASPVYAKPYFQKTTLTSESTSEIFPVTVQKSVKLSSYHARVKVFTIGFHHKSLFTASSFSPAKTVKEDSTSNIQTRSATLYYTKRLTVTSLSLPQNNSITYYQQTSTSNINHESFHDADDTSKELITLVITRKNISDTFQSKTYQKLTTFFKKQLSTIFVRAQATRSQSFFVVFRSSPSPLSHSLNVLSADISQTKPTQAIDLHIYVSVTHIQSTYTTLTYETKTTLPTTFFLTKLTYAAQTKTISSKPYTLIFMPTTLNEAENFTEKFLQTTSAIIAIHPVTADDYNTKQPWISSLARTKSKTILLFTTLSEKLFFVSTCFHTKHIALNSIKAKTNYSSSDSTSIYSQEKLKAFITVRFHFFSHSFMTTIATETNLEGATLQYPKALLTLTATNQAKFTLVAVTYLLENFFLAMTSSLKLPSKTSTAIRISTALSQAQALKTLLWTKIPEYESFKYHEACSWTNALLKIKTVPTTSSHTEASFQRWLVNPTSQTTQFLLRSSKPTMVITISHVSHQQVFSSTSAALMITLMTHLDLTTKHYLFNTTIASTLQNIILKSVTAISMNSTTFQHSNHSKLALLLLPNVTSRPTTLQMISIISETGITLAQATKIKYFIPYMSSAAASTFFLTAPATVATRKIQNGFVNFSATTSKTVGLITSKPSTSSKVLTTDIQRTTGGKQNFSTIIAVNFLHKFLIIFLH